MNEPTIEEQRDLARKLCNLMVQKLIHQHAIAVNPRGTMSRGFGLPTFKKPEPIKRIHHNHNNNGTF